MMKLFQLHMALSPRAKFLIGVLSFVLPIALWCIVSYVPAVWHPQVLITDAGSIDYLQIDMRMDRAAFDSEVARAKAEGRAPPEGVRSNPIYLPSPGEVAAAFYTVLHDAAANPGRRMAASKSLAQHSDHFLGLRNLVHHRRAARTFFAGLTLAVSRLLRALRRVFSLSARAGIRRTRRRHLGHL